MENKLLRGEVNRHFDFENIIGQSQAMQSVFDTIKKVAATEGTVLIHGKSGTGKELVARAIHFNSKRAGKPFIAVNCGAIVENLFESELFGHKRGSFTGATIDREGFFKAADTGTLFLDEVSEIPSEPPGQAPARDRAERDHAGRHGRSDLASMCASSPPRTRTWPRRSRPAATAKTSSTGSTLSRSICPRLPSGARISRLLVQHFVAKHAQEMNKPVRGVDNEVMKSLLAHSWKGEIRELENIIERAVIFAEGSLITKKDLPSFFEQRQDAVYCLRCPPLHEGRGG